MACDHPASEYDCEAIVIGNVNQVGVSCSQDVFHLKFLSGEDKIKALLHDSVNVQDSTYHALNLPEDLKIQGLHILLNARTPTANEMPACLNCEMPLFIDPIVWIIRAEKN